MISELQYRKCIILLILIVFGINYSHTQTESAMLRGVAKDALTGEGLPFVNVQILGTKFGTSSNANGLFMFKGLPKGKHRIVIFTMGYEKKIEEIDFDKLEDKVYAFKLKPSPIELSSVVKEEERIKSENYANISVQNLTAEDLKIIPLPVEKDIFRSLKTIPGVSTSSDVSSQFFVRGGSGDQNLILYDNMVIYNPFHALGIFSIFDGNAIKSFELQSGGFDPEYGGRLSSVLNVTTKDGNRNNFTTNWNLSMLSLHGSVSAPYPFGTASLYFRKSVFDDILKKYTGQDVPLSFYDVSGKATIDFTESGKISLHVFKSGDKIESITKYDPEYTWQNSAYSVNFPSFISQYIFTASYSYSDYNINMSYLNPGYGYNNGKSNLENLRATLKFDYLFESNDLVSAGLLVYNLQSGFKSVNKFDISMNYSKEHAERSFWIKYRFTGLHNTIIEPGLRHSYTGSGNNSRNVLEPRLNIKYKMSDHISLKGSFSRMHQAMISIQNDDDVLPLYEAWLPISERYHPERADQYVIGVDARLNDNINFTLQSYYKTINNFLGYNLDKETEEQVDFLPGTGESKGLELYVKFNYGRIYGWLTYNLSWATRTTNGLKYYPRYDKRHIVSVVAGIKLPFNIDMGIVWDFATGMPFTPINGIFYQPDIEMENPSDEFNAHPYLFLGAKNSSRLPFYHKLDINFSRSFMFFELIKTNVSLDITNVYDQRNIFYLNNKTGDRVNMIPFFISMAIGVEI